MSLRMVSTSEAVACLSGTTSSLALGAATSSCATIFTTRRMLNAESVMMSVFVGA